MRLLLFGTYLSIPIHGLRCGKSLISVHSLRWTHLCNTRTFVVLLPGVLRKLSTTNLVNVGLKKIWARLNMLTGKDATAHIL